MKAKLLVLMTTIACTTLLSAGYAAEPTATVFKVVLQVSDGDPAKWNSTLNNVKNVQADLGVDKVKIEMVVYGHGLGMLKFDALTANQVSEAVQSGVQIVACENTMASQKISKDEMNASIGYVHAGIVEIIKRQQEGWAYVRP
jgi:intracellular sulfur oxidation DsrE/DsrF family protein